MLDDTKLVLMNVRESKKFRIRHRKLNVFFAINNADMERFELLFPRRTDLQKQRYDMLDKLVRAAYDAGFIQAGR